MQNEITTEMKGYIAIARAREISQAPADKDKLIAFIDSLASTKMPDVKSDAAKKIVELTTEKLRIVYFELKFEINKL